MKNISKIIRLIIEFKRMFFRSGEEILFSSLVLRRNKSVGRKKILIQTLDDPFFVFRTFLATLPMGQDIVFYTIDTMDPIWKRSYDKWYSSFVRYLGQDNFLRKKTWSKNYAFLNSEKNFRIAEMKESDVRLGKISSVDELINYSISGIVVGDLIYDSYLRYNHSVTVDLEDPFLYQLIRKSHKISMNIHKILDEYSFDNVFVTYSSYIYHGILTRIALHKNINVTSLAGGTQLYLPLSRTHHFHTRDMKSYKNDLKKINFTEEEKSNVKAKLNERFEGKIDKATSYMAHSAFSDRGEKIELDQSSILILCHDFYDSPHIYGDLLFPDFYLWLDFVCQQAENSRYKFYLKPHPNGIKGNLEIVESFRNKYPKIVILDSKISNNSLINAGFNFILTVYGTCGHEFPYKGIPAVCCGDNPHSSFNFTTRAQSKEELKKILLGEVEPLRAIDKSEIIDFFYMHNLSLTGGRTEVDIKYQHLFKYYSDFSHYVEMLKNEVLPHLDAIRDDYKPQCTQNLERN